MMRVLFLGHNAGRTGAPVMLLHLLRWLHNNAEIDFELLLRGDGALAPEYCSLGNTWDFSTGKQIRNSALTRKLAARLPGFLLRGPEQARAKLLRYFVQQDFDLIYSNTITNGDLLEWLSPLGIPAITHVHEMSHWIESCGERNLELVRAHTSKYVAASHAVKSELVRKWEIPAAKITVVHEFIPTHQKPPTEQEKSALRNALGISQNAFVVVGSGAETWRKGKDLFIEVAKKVTSHPQEKSILFLWVGGWESQENESAMLKVVSEAGLDNCVSFVGEVTNPLDYFSAADVFAMTSREDPYPLVCLESALVNTPIVCFADAGGMPEFVEEDAGYVVPHCDVNAMAERVIFLERNREDAEARGKCASRKVRSRHDVGVGSKQLARLMASVVDSIGAHGQLSHRIGG